MKCVIITLLLAVAAMVYLQFSPEKKKKALYEFVEKSIPESSAEYPPSNATHHGDGLYSAILEPAKNNLALNQQDVVTVSYDGWSLNSKKHFDSSIKHPKPFKYRVNFGGFNQVIEGWKRIIPIMKEGEKRRVWIPNHLAYGEKARLPHLAETLIFDIQIDAVERALKEPQIDRHPLTPSSHALTVHPGIQSIIIEESDSDQSPSPTDLVKVSLSIWDENNKLYQSTQQTQKPLQLSLKNSVKGISLALQSLKVGEKKRFWIAPNLLYKNNEGPALFPKGTIIADIQLLEICPEVKILIHPTKPAR